jgi:hypothetical protein
VEFARRSEPPCFSVKVIPMMTPAFSSAGTNRGSYVRLKTRGSHRSAISGWWRMVGTTDQVIEIGQPWPSSTWLTRRKCAERETAAPGRSSSHPWAWTPADTDSSISWW